MVTIYLGREGFGVCNEEEFMKWVTYARAHCELLGEDVVIEARLRGRHLQTDHIEAPTEERRVVLTKALQELWLVWCEEGV
jgi:hypothetical protein